MPTAEIITIGTEILLGEIIDTNASYIARRLRDHGIDVFRTSSVGDNVQRIASMVREALSRADLVITTGGLGPTVDDPTREAVALAFGVNTEFREDLWQQVIDRFARFDRTPTENNKRQAYVPEGAAAIENEVGTAPAFLMDTSQGITIALPGVPREMEHLLAHKVLPYMQQRFDLSSVLVLRVLHTAGVGESQVDERIGDLEELANPTVGLAAHSGQVDVRISAKAENEAAARALIAPLEAELRKRLGSWVYGADNESLEIMAADRLRGLGWTLCVLEAGLDGRLVRRFAGQADVFLKGEVLPMGPAEPRQLLNDLHNYRNHHAADAGLAAALYPGDKVQEIYLALITPQAEKFIRVPYGGPPQLAPRRAVNYGMDLIRKITQERGA